MSHDNERGMLQLTTVDQARMKAPQTTQERAGLAYVLTLWEPRIAD